MQKDNPDTVTTGEATQWQATQVDDVFLPTVRVMVGWDDIEGAVRRGAVVPQQAHKLWSIWAAPGSPLRLAAMERMEPPEGPGWAQSAVREAPNYEEPFTDEPVLPGHWPGHVLRLLVAAALGAALTYWWMAG